MGLGCFAYFRGSNNTNLGNFNRLLVPYDPDGKGCGIDYPDFPYIFFASPHHDVQKLEIQSLWVTTCVSECPKGGDAMLKCMPNSVVTTCYPRTTTNNNDSIAIYTTHPGTYLMNVQSPAASASRNLNTFTQKYRLLYSPKIASLAFPI